MIGGNVTRDPITSARERRLSADNPRLANWANIRRIIKTINYFWLRKYARIVVLLHYLFLEAHSCPRASLSGNCSLLRTDNILGQLSVHISSPKVVYCLYNLCQGTNQKTRNPITVVQFLINRNIFTFGGPYWGAINSSKLIALGLLSVLNWQPKQQKDSLHVTCMKFTLKAVETLVNKTLLVSRIVILSPLPPPPPPPPPLPTLEQLANIGRGDMRISANIGPRSNWLLMLWCPCHHLGVFL